MVSGHSVTQCKKRQLRLPLLLWSAGAKLPPFSMAALLPSLLRPPLSFLELSTARKFARQAARRKLLVPARSWCNPSLLESTLPAHPTSVHSKGLNKLPSSLESPLTKNRGEGVPLDSRYWLSATKIISGESSEIGVRSKFPYCAVTLNPHRASKCSTS